MELYNAIHGRRSIRIYAPGAVSDDALERILRAAMAAPSAVNEQPWHFLIIRDRRTLQALSESHPYAEMVAHAALAIIVCVDMNLVKRPDFWQHDCAAATQNILLAVHGEGLGSVWVGVYPREARIAEVRSVIALPEHVHPFSILPIGVPGEIKGPEDRYKPARVHEDTW